MRPEALGSVAQSVRGIALRRFSDDEIVARAVSNDPVAFSEFYRRYHSRVHGFCLSRLMSADAATEATQEVFVRVLSATPGTVHNPTSWLLGIARHVCIDVARQAASCASGPVSDDALASAQSHLDTETSVLDRNGARNIMLALRRLKPRYRTALILKEIHQQPMEDVAQALGVSVPTAYVVLSRSRDAFGKAYAQLGDLDPACRAAVELIHRRTGTGVSASETAALDAHLAQCGHCRKEERTATSGAGMAAALPFIPGLVEPHGLIARAASMLGQSMPALDSARNLTPLFERPVAHTLAVAAATAGIVVATVGVTPVAWRAMQAPEPSQPAQSIRAREAASGEAGAQERDARSQSAVATCAENQSAEKVARLQIRARDGARENEAARARARQAAWGGAETGGGAEKGDAGKKAAAGVTRAKGDGAGAGGAGGGDAPAPKQHQSGAGAPAASTDAASTEPAHDAGGDGAGGPGDAGGEGAGAASQGPDSSSRP